MPHQPLWIQLLAQKFPLRREQACEPGEYCMWWRTHPEETITNSRDLQIIGLMQQMAASYGTYLIADIAATIGAAPPGTMRLDYPADNKEGTFVLRGPADQPILLTMSQETGLQWHVKESRGVVERSSLFNAVGEWAACWYEIAQRQKLPPDPPNSCGAAWFWKVQKDLFEGRVEGSGKVNKVGVRILSVPS